MDYKEKYNQALVKAKDMLNYKEVRQEDMEYLFPELKESDGEEVKRAMIDFFKHEREENVTVLHYGVNIERMIAWLEKQSEMDMESYKDAEDEKREFVGDGFIKCYANFQDFKEGETYWLEYVGNDNYNVRSDNLLGKTYHITPCQLYTIFKKQTWLEKQGEQNPIMAKSPQLGVQKSYWKPSKDEMDALYGLAYITNKMDDKKDEAVTKLYQDLKREFFNGASYENMFPSSPVNSDINIEKQGEQKPNYNVEPKDYNSIDPHFGKSVDKVEPKFRVGDWIVRDGKILQISYIDKVIDGTLHYWFTEGTWLSSAKMEDAHLWTIQDAKDGDVLADNVGVILFKSIGDNNVINFHAYLSGLFAVQEGEHYWGHVRECTLSPATKEQRERFFAKMHEAGWEFDFERKELKKIENEIEIPFGAKDSELQEATYFIPKGFHAEIDDDKVVIKKGEKPITWSEEDTFMYNKIKNLLTDISLAPESRNSLFDWLKSLKGRVGCEANCTTTKEWREEDEQHIDSLLKRLDGLCRNEFERTRFAISEDRDWLESLKQKYTWKPSEKQMEALKEACDEHWEPDGLDPLYTLYQELKKLRGE